MDSTNYELTCKYYNRWKCKDGKYRHVLHYYLNDITVLTLCYAGSYCHGNYLEHEYIMNNRLYAIRFTKKGKVKQCYYPLKSIIKQFNIPKDFKIFNRTGHLYNLTR